MASETILFDVERGLAWITLHRPNVKNAINAEMREALLDALDRVASDPGIEVFVRRGLAVDAGGAFLLSRTLGLHKAKELVLLGDALSAQDACALGLCNRVVPRASWSRRHASGASGSPAGRLLRSVSPSDS